MQKFYVRTDLADEARQIRLDEAEEIQGVEAESLNIYDCAVTKVSVLDERGAKAIGKSTGVYYTLEMDKFVRRREVSFTDCANAVADILNQLSAVRESKTFLVACIGNRGITPDSVGPCVADGLIVTRHLKSSLPEQFAAFSSVSVLRTGVLGITGIESAEAVKSICELTKPDCVIAVDALACGEIARLCRNIQISDSGISPGSGVGNNRQAINRETLGVPVISMGIPTVIDASAFTDDEDAKGLFVTPRNIDELVKSVSKVLAYGINLAVHDGLSVEDIDMLIE